MGIQEAKIGKREIRNAMNTTQNKTSNESREKEIFLIRMKKVCMKWLEWGGAEGIL